MKADAVSSIEFVFCVIVDESLRPTEPGLKHSPCPRYTRGACLKTFIQPMFPYGNINFFRVLYCTEDVLHESVS